MEPLRALPDISLRTHRLGQKATLGIRAWPWRPGPGGWASDVDCPARASAPLHGRRVVGPHLHLRGHVRGADEEGHLPQHRHPGGGGGVELPGLVGGGHGAPHRPHQRAGLFHHHRRDSAHRVPVHRRHRPAENLLPAWRGPRDGHRPNQLCVADGQPHHAARDSAPKRAALQRRKRPGSPAHHQQPDAVRAATVRLQPQLLARPALHHPRDVHPGPLRRQAAPNHGRRESGGDLGQGTFSAGRRHRAARLQCHRPSRDGANRQHRVQRQAQLEPRDGGAVQRAPRKGGEWRHRASGGRGPCA